MHHVTALKGTKHEGRERMKTATGLDGEHGHTITLDLRELAGCPSDRNDETDVSK